MSDAAYDPLSPEVLANPFPTYRLFRQEAPVQYYSGLGSPYYVLFRYGDVFNASTNTEDYTAKYGAGPAIGEPTVMFNDGERHLAFRVIVQSRFTPRAIESYRVQVRKLVGGLIETLVEKGPPTNLLAEFALPLPVQMTCLLLGVDLENWREMAELADQLLASSWLLRGDEAARVQERARAMFGEWIAARQKLLEDAGVAEARKEHVGKLLPDDLVSDAMAGKVEGRHLTREEMDTLFQVLLVGGVDTTAHLISNLVWRLLEDRSRWEAVKAEPDRLIPVAIEESLRFDPPGLGLWRTTARDLEVAGVRIGEHNKVQMSYGSANRDPSVFNDPDTFRLDRPMTEMKKHLTFGAGAHLCIGQHLARLEASEALRAMIERLPGLRLSGGTERTENFGFWGRQKLPVEW